MNSGYFFKVGILGSMRKERESRSNLGPPDPFACTFLKSGTQCSETQPSSGALGALLLDWGLP